MSAGGEYRERLRTIQDLFEYHSTELRLNLKMHHFYETSLVITWNEGSNYWHLAIIAEFIVPFTFVFDIMSLFHDKGLISLNGLDWVMIFDAPPETEGRIIEFEVATIPGAESYYVILKRLVVSDEGFWILDLVLEQVHKLSAQS